MNEIVNKLLLARHKFMTEIHLRQPQLRYNACKTFNKDIERKKKIKETGDSRYIFQNHWNKTCFPHNMAYEDFKDINRRTAADKWLRDKVFNIAINPKYDGYQCGFSSMVYKFLVKKSSSNDIKKETMQNKELSKELHKTIITK